MMSVLPFNTFVPAILGVGTYFIRGSLVEGGLLADVVLEAGLQMRWTWSM